MKSEARFTLSRIAIIVLSILIQMIYIGALVWSLAEYYMIGVVATTAIAVALVLWIVSRDINPSFKISWIILILVIPIFGILIYFLLGRPNLTKGLKVRGENAEKKLKPYVVFERNVINELEEKNPVVAKQSKYLEGIGKFPLYTNTKTEYFAKTEDAFEELKAQLRQAKSFIFMEYFIVADDSMWNEILDILKEKAKEGVEVRFIYDDMGSVTRLPYKYEKSLEQFGIQCRVFNPLMPLLSIVMNHRDHRKITVIDGLVGFTGGFNLADEYINRTSPHGLWKDAAVKIEGEAVASFTAMFLQMWNTIKDSDTVEDCKQYFLEEYPDYEEEGSGYVQPYCDTPLDHECVGENVYLNMIQNAKKYVYCFTPYLILDNETVEAFCLAAKSGIDVRIVTPNIPDKKMVFRLSQSYYKPLINAGVKIYQYTPGFIHSKCFLSDDKIAVCGTINLDYRSLYLHFECGCLLYHTRAVMQMKEDMEKTFRQSMEITKEFCDNTPFLRRVLQSILKLFAPLL